MFKIPPDILGRYNQSLHAAARTRALRWESTYTRPLSNVSSSLIGSKIQRSSTILQVTRSIVKDEKLLGFYRGFGPVVSGIIPKMAVRFTLYERYKDVLLQRLSVTPFNASLCAGFAAGASEAVLVVNPVEVVKIRLQAQNCGSAALTQGHSSTVLVQEIIRTEGIGALYHGISLTILRQGINQAANFTAYMKLKSSLQKLNNSSELCSWQISTIGFISGSIGPLLNAPIDSMKTRLQKSARVQRGDQVIGPLRLFRHIWKAEGLLTFWRGTLPRVIRVAAGQSVTFTVYEFLMGKLSGNP
jgi:solute carrier family 25 citrate transporter 1